MATEKSTTRSLVWFVLGAATGAVAGVLFAPKSGKETREQLGDWLQERREKGTLFLTRIKETLPVKRGQIASAIKAGKDAYFKANKEEEVAA